MAIHWRILMRKWHRWGAILTAVPFLLIIVSGILLQLKKEWSWVQPPTAKGKGDTPTVSLDAIFEATKSVPEAEVSGWNDIDRLDLQPRRGVVKVQAKNRWEVQIDLQTAKVLQVAYRRSDLIESLHDGSFFDDRVKLWVFLPVAVIVFTLWGTGIYLFFLPIIVRWSKRQRSKSGTN